MSALVPARSKTRRCRVWAPGPGTAALPLVASVRPAAAPGPWSQLASRHVLSRIHEELIVVEVGGAVVGVIDDDAPTAAVAPLAVDDGALIGRQHRRVRRYGEIRTPMAVIGVAPGAVEADHRPVVLPVGVMVVRPRGYAWMRVGKRQGQVPGCRRGLRGEQGQGNGKSYRPVQP